MPPTPSRRTVLLGGAAALGLAACSHAARQARALTHRPPPSTSSTSSGPAATVAAGGGPAAFVGHGPRAGTAVALTFHGSGDPALTAAMLDATRRLALPITVFAVGRWLEQHPDLSGRILAAGHELANHTYTHPALGRLGAAAVAAEITRCRDVLAGQTGSGGRWFRPSGIDVPTQLMLDQAGLAGYRTVVGYDVDPHDYQDPGPAAVGQRVAAGLRPGSIVSLHLGHAGTVSAMDAIAAAVRERGLRAVTVGQLLGPAG
jgi:peptidoglycan/xylan/chitin deacetylase (PgdA/CDA1 family)